MTRDTPYYLIDERKLLRNLTIIEQVRDCSGAKSVLALKCFAAWAVFPLLRKYMDGTTASSPYEARLGKERFGKEVHVYSVGYSDLDIREIGACSDTIIFNSVSQLTRFYPGSAAAESACASIRAGAILILTWLIRRASFPAWA